MKTKITIVDTIKQAYGNPSEAARLIEFHTDSLSSPWAKKCVSSIGRYNMFHPKLVNEAISKVDHLVDSWVVGREYSPVIYAKVYDLTPDKEAKIRQAFEQARVDEFHNTDRDLNPGNYHWGHLRLWWD